MARGKQLDNETVYKIMASYEVTNSFTATANELKLPICTVEQTYKRNKDKEEFIKLHNNKKDMFADMATNIIDKALKRLETELDNKDNNIAVNQLSTVIGTLYDKRALANGQATANVNVGFKLEDFIK